LESFAISQAIVRFSGKSLTLKIFRALPSAQAFRSKSSLRSGLSAAILNAFSHNLLSQ
jgi:hypothetical protein